MEDTITKPENARKAASKGNLAARIDVGVLDRLNMLAAKRRCWPAALVEEALTAYLDLEEAKCSGSQG